MRSYSEFLRDKTRRDVPTGLSESIDTLPALFPFQEDVVRWALRRGRAAIFADCGLGKTLMQLEWARHIPGRVLILAPLAVAQQTEREAIKFGLHAEYRRTDCGDDVTITNYEMLDHFDPEEFTGVVLDESSILKSYDGKTRTAIIESFKNTPFRLACTATPAPNDHTELGNHSEFLGVMSRVEMLSTFFVHDGGSTQNWRLKKHAVDDFWRWVCSWAVLIQSPADLGYDDSDYQLPAIRHIGHVVESPNTNTDTLFALEAQTLQERQAARKHSTKARVEACADLVNDSDDTWIVWCNLNAESAALADAIPDAIEVHGAQSNAAKAEALNAFTDGKYRVLVTKPSIAGFGMNWQHCAKVAFVGLSDSWEQYYQAIRRCWRFGQTRTVDVHMITSEAEGAVVANLKLKEQKAQQMVAEVTSKMRDEMRRATAPSSRDVARFETATTRGKNWEMRLGDCVEELAQIEDDSVDYSVFSPPFASLYTYSASDRDMGNCVDNAEFMTHFGFAVQHLFRVLRPGRLVSFHCMPLPTSKVRDGVIGLRDFRGELVRLFESHGFIYHSEVCIWKDPVTAMQRTKALGLLHKQLKKDSCMSRQGLPDYLVTVRKPGANTRPVTHTNESFPVRTWQDYASPVWMDINPNDTLQHRSAREHADERHICPLQLEVIRRALVLWSAPGDLVLSPFGGIGSEGYVSLEMGRRYLGIELKRSYFEQAVRNLEYAERDKSTATLFDEVAS